MSLSSSYVLIIGKVFIKNFLKSSTPFSSHTLSSYSGETIPCVKELYQQANHLPAIEKLRLVELLLADLDTSGPGYDIIWRDQVQKRWQAYQDGRLKAVNYVRLCKNTMSQVLIDACFKLRGHLCSD
jgi:hypothetical protein